VIVITGFGFTVTVIGTDMLQFVGSTPVTVYMVVVAGVAMTVGPVVVFKPAAGVHENVTPGIAVDAVSVTLSPGQRDALVGVAFIAKAPL
jgi:hypothetical protein